MRASAVLGAVLACGLCATLAACGTDRPEAAPDPPAVTVEAPPTPLPELLSPAAPAAAPPSVVAPPPPPAVVAAPSPTPARAPRTAPAPAVALTALAPVPASPADPEVRFPVNPAAVGAGANALVTPIPDALWAGMVGTAWTPGCPVGRAELRAVAVNFWGFDGVRSRGTVVVAAAIADRTAAAFTTLYESQFRIRQLRPMDASWGRAPAGPGADDYAAMAADNTSGFNCRYVGGQEAAKVWSNHAYGRAIDINDVENPYVTDDGRVFPSRHFLDRSPAPGVLTAGSPQVKAFTSRGFSWGGRWSAPDYQHLEVPR